MQREMEVARAALSALREAGAGYADVRVNRLETERRTERLTVFFDKKGNVTGYGFDKANDPKED